ncbi:fungal hydrophobin [Suillus bovinus]|uniref:fungal hydrophobin n=1 Tax=Suillus bovinus TaxID=48563 RepID=UPI001B86A248|nr:fungal hydrophobin [Suillus bovinus]KAG2143486.1 fungal hydrophobin [Suillus bovinus]
MFVRILSITSLAVLAIATPLALRDSSGQCNTGTIQCCQSTQPVDDYNKNATISGGIPIFADIFGDVGLGCSPINVIGTGDGATCFQQPVCCSNESYNGLVNIGCTPINIFL